MPRQRTTVNLDKNDWEKFKNKYPNQKASRELRRLIKEDIREDRDARERNEKNIGEDYSVKEIDDPKDEENQVGEENAHDVVSDVKEGPISLPHSFSVEDESDVSDRRGERNEVAETSVKSRKEDERAKKEDALFGDLF